MVPARALTDLVALIKDVRDVKSAAERTRQSVEEDGDVSQATQLAALHKAHDPPRRTAIVLSFVWTALGGMFLLPQSVATNPFLERLMSNSGAFYWWLATLFAGLVVVVVLYVREELIKRRVNQLFSFQVQQRALVHLIRDERDVVERGGWDPEFDGPSPDAFSRHFLQQGLKAEVGLVPWYRSGRYVHSRAGKAGWRLGSRGVLGILRRLSRLTRRAFSSVPDEVIESAADLCIERFLVRGKIRPIDPRQHGDPDSLVLDDWFELVPASPTSG
jgi:ABC-type multidrug transport system fused ATPase/permease subunit